MSATQRARSGVPLDRRSIIGSVPGLPWWGVILVAVGVTCLGFAVDAVRGSELTATFSTFYILGCLLAVAAASNRALFTAIVQPPLILFFGVPLGQSLIADKNSTALRDLAINIAYPLVNRFPVMLAATALVLVIGGTRLFFVQQRRNRPPRRSERRRASRPSRNDRSRTRDEAADTDDPGNRARSRGTRSSRADRVKDAETVREQPRRGRHGSPPPRSSPSARATGIPPVADYGSPLARPASGSWNTQVPRSGSRSRTNAELPAHPIPRVRYRDRYEPPYESEHPR